MARGRRDVGDGNRALTAATALEDNLRRGMYAFIRRVGRPVTRDEAAASVGISRKLAAFHLDKLVDHGLLRAHYEPVGGIRKVGRTPKVYEPSGLEIQVSIPQRQHGVLAEILLEAVQDEDGAGSASRAALVAARRHGTELGTELGTEHRGAEPELLLAEKTLERQGFEPYREAANTVRLRNCPFHPLAAQAPHLVCAINEALITGLLEGLQASTVRAALAPRPNECCVELTSDPVHRTGTS